MAVAESLILALAAPVDCRTECLAEILGHLAERRGVLQAPLSLLQVESQRSGRLAWLVYCWAYGASELPSSEGGLQPPARGFPFLSLSDGSGISGGGSGVSGGGGDGGESPLRAGPGARRTRLHQD